MKNIRNLCVSVSLMTLLISPGMVLAGPFSDLEEKHMSKLDDAIKIQVKAKKIHDKVLTIDTHQDTPGIMADYARYSAMAGETIAEGEEFDLGVRYVPLNLGPWKLRQVDFQRMKEGGLDASFFVAFVSQGERTPEGNQAAQDLIFDRINLIHEKVGDHPDLAGIAYTPKDAYKLEKQGKRAIYIAIENGYAIGDDLSLIETYYDMGVSYMTLSHSSNNDICDSSTDPFGPEFGGLSSFGEAVVAEMNRLGMMVDVSHTSDDTVWDVLELTTAPVIASHSNVLSLYDHPRNISDDLLSAIADNGGVVQVNFLYVTEDGYGSGNPLGSTVSDVVDHIDHIVSVAGIDHVGIGTDFDGGGVIGDCQDVSQLEAVTVELVKRGYNQGEIRKIWGGNLMRVFKEVQKDSSK